MIDYVNRELFHKGSVRKQLLIQFDDTTITNNRIYQEGFELLESLCSQDSLKFGCCEASQLKLKIRNEYETLIDKWLDVSLVINNDTENPLQIGKFKANSCELSGDKKYVNITAYDAMYDIINMDVVSWYDSLTFPLTLKEFRDNFFEYVGFEQEDIVLTQDSMIVDKTIEADELSGLTVISAICEINGVFGHINRQGKFVYVSLIPKQDELYPDDELYPSDELYPIEFATDENVQAYETYVSCEYEDFETEYISSLQIRQEADDIGVIVGDGSNRYVVEDNFLVYGKEIDDLTEIAEALYEKIREVQYRPFKGVAQGNPCIEVGDAIVFYTRNMDVESYVFERTLKGIQSLRDTFEAKGTIEYEDEVNSTHRDVVKLKGKTNVLERTIEETKSTITDVENNLQSQITQNATEINATVSSLQKEVSDSTESTNEAITELQKEVSAKMTDEEVSIEIKKAISDGVNKVETSTGYIFDENGLKIEKSGSEMSTQITEDGMTVYKNGEDVLKANHNGVDAVNLHATTYLIVGANSRFEDYGDGRTGCFYIGGGV